MGDSEYPPFSFDKPRFDTTTYFGRVRHFINVVSPTNLLITDKELSDATKLLDMYQSGNKTAEMTDRALWSALETKNAIIHPDTGDKIPIYARMSAFVPVNVPIVFGMVMSPPTLVNIVGWQWINQTYNVIVNYANRNATLEMSTAQIATAYGAAVGTSVGLGVGLNQLVKRLAMPPNVRAVLGVVVPYTAVAAAGAANVFAIRNREISEGIHVQDQYGMDCGVSKVAGKSAVTQVALTRVVLPLPVIIMPPLVMGLLNKMRVVPSNKYGKLFTEISVITVCLLGALPAAIGVFPQNSSIDAGDLEPEFQNKMDKNGQPIKTFYFNKGL